MENYKSIILLSVLYKTLTKIITNRLSQKFDFYQPIEQVGFRKGFNTMNHSTQSKLGCVFLKRGKGIIKRKICRM